MYLIIDGYNLLHKVIKTRPDERDKNQFVNQLLNYAARKGHKLIVVFDGGSLPIATHDRHDGVTIVHVGYKETADDYIKRVLDDPRKDMALVSSDNALIKHAKMVGVDTVDSATFAKILADKKVETQSGAIIGDRIKRITSPASPMAMPEHGSEDQELAALLEQESRSLPIKEEDVNFKIRTAHTPSKKEKQQSKILKKL